MSSFRKMLSILDLFSLERPTLKLEDIVLELNITIPTCYRYLKELSDVGLLAKLEGGEYIVGPKIIRLDHFIRSTTPTIVAAAPIMKDLSDFTGCTVLLSNIYNDEVLNVHVESNVDASFLTYNRGVPHPLFRGATSKIIFANLPKSRLQKMYDDYKSQIKAAKLGETFQIFYHNMTKIKKMGYCISKGELDENVSGIAAPIFYKNQVNGSITLVYPSARENVYNIERLIELVCNAAESITLQSN